jgi:3-oxoacyl-[acyl-carrier protein] reductase
MTNTYKKIALVTGASRGIGRATALALANAGVRVIIHYGRSASEAESLRKQIRRAGGDVDTISADLAAPDGAAKLAEQVRDILGEKLDILVANAGVSKAAPIEDHTVEDFDNLFATNVRAPFFLVQQLLPVLGENSSVVLVSSLAARGAPGGSQGAISLPAYASTKGADTLVKHFAAILGPRGIRVNAVAPGVIETDMSSFTKTAIGYPLQNFNFTFTELRVRNCFRELESDGCREPVAASGNCVNRFFDLLVIGDFDQVPSCSSFHRPVNILFVFISC